MAGNWGSIVKKSKDPVGQNKLSEDPVQTMAPTSMCVVLSINIVSLGFTIFQISESKGDFKSQVQAF